MIGDPIALAGRGARSISGRRGVVVGGDRVGGRLRAAGLAVTAPRRAVLELLAGREQPLSAADIFDLLRASGSRLGLTSVYRVLHSFAVGEIVHVFYGGEQRFRVCDPRPHAHLVCEQCGRVIERPADAVRHGLMSAAGDVDFVPNAERSDIYGRCGRCQPPDPGAGRRGEDSGDAPGVP